jgi:hypothetical protein
VWLRKLKLKIFHHSVTCLNAQMKYILSLQKQSSKSNYPLLVLFYSYKEFFFPFFAALMFFIWILFIFIHSHHFMHRFALSLFLIQKQNDSTYKRIFKWPSFRQLVPSLSKLTHAWNMYLYIFHISLISLFSHYSQCIISQTTYAYKYFRFIWSPSTVAKKKVK